MLRTKILEERKAILEEGIEKGEESGAEKKSIAVAELGIKNGLSDEMIHTLTGLDLQKIRTIRKNLESS